MNKNKLSKYTKKLEDQLYHIFRDEKSKSYIYVRELEAGIEDDSENLKTFIYALSTVLPLQIYNELWDGPDLSHLEFNHFINTLCIEEKIEAAKGQTDILNIRSKPNNC